MLVGAGGWHADVGVPRGTGLEKSMTRFEGEGECFGRAPEDRETAAQLLEKGPPGFYHSCRHGPWFRLWGGGGMETLLELYRSLPKIHNNR